MKKWSIGFFLLVVMISIRVFFFPDKKHDEPKFKGKKRSAVQILRVQQQKLNELYYVTGSLNPEEKISITPEISGRIKEIYFTEGESISAGALLIKLNDADLQASKRKAMAQLSLSEKKVKRLKEVLPLNGISKEEFELALASEEFAQAELQAINAQIDKTEIKAPFSGVIGLRNISPGSMVNAQTEIATLQKIDYLKLDFSLPEKYAAILSRNAKVSFQTSNISENTDAIVTAVDASVNTETRTIAIRAKVKNIEKKFFAGQFVKVEIPLAKKENAILIPSEAIVSDMRGKKVYVVVNGRAESRIIKSGLRSESKLEILEGLKEGDSLVVSGLSNLREGAEVKPLSK